MASLKLVLTHLLVPLLFMILRLLELNQQHSLALMLIIYILIRILKLVIQLFLYRYVGGVYLL